MKITRLSHAYSFPGFRALSTVKQQPENPATVVVTLKRRYEKKDQNAPNAAPGMPSGTTADSSEYGTSTAATSGYTLSSKSGASSARSAAS